MDDLEVPTGFDKARFGCLATELDKLNSDDGCQLKIIPESKTIDLDDESFSDSEEGIEDSPNYTTQRERLDRMRREYLEISLNANRDPSLDEPQPALAKLLGAIDEEDEEQGSENIDPQNKITNSRAMQYEDEPRASLYTSYKEPVHERYEKLGNYDEMLADPNKSFEEITPSLVFKRRLIMGAGSRVTENSLVIYNCALWTENIRDPFDSSWLRNKTLITDMSEDSILPGIRDLLLSMRRNEWSEALIRPRAAFGELGVRPRIPPNATIFCVLEMIKVIDKDKLSFLQSIESRTGTLPPGTTFEDFYAVSNQARMRGNYYIMRKMFKPAIQRYKSGIRILEGLNYKNEEEEEKAKDLLLRLYNNLARAFNSAGEPRLALNACKQASLLNPGVLKTEWHRLVAWKKRGHFDRAQSVARRALQLAPDEKSRKIFKSELSEIDKKISSEKSELDELHRLMARSLVS